MPAFMSSAYHTRAIHEDLPHQRRGICSLTWLVLEYSVVLPRGQQSLIGPHHPSQLFSKGSCHSLGCEGERERELGKEETSEGADGVVLDPGNVNTEALHQGSGIHPGSPHPQPLENETEKNLQSG